MTNEEKSSQEKLKEKFKNTEAKLELEISGLFEEIQAFNFCLADQNMKKETREELEDKREDSASTLERKQNELTSLLVNISKLEADINANLIASESNTIQKWSARISIAGAVAAWAGAGVTLWLGLKK